MLAVGICHRRFLQLARTQLPLRCTRPLVAWCVSAIAPAHAADMRDVVDGAREAAVGRNLPFSPEDRNAALTSSSRAEQPMDLAGPRHKHQNKRRRVAAEVPKCSTVSRVEREKYAEQLARKVAKVRELFADFRLPELESFASEPEHYRLR